MGLIVKEREMFCMAHSITGKVVTRNGRRACFRSRSVAVRDKINMECRVMGVCPPGATTKSLIGTQ